MTSQTPKTDANLLFLDCDDSCLDIYVKTKDGKEVTGDIVSADLARELELENAAMREAVKLSSSAFARTLHLLEHVPATREMEILCSGAEEDIRSAILKLEPFLK